MQSLKTQTHIGTDGILKLELPVDVADTDVELVIVLQSVKSNAVPEKVEKFDRAAAIAIIEQYQDVARKNGWPDGFFEETYGAFADDPIERPPQGQPEVRDELL